MKLKKKFIYNNYPKKNFNKKIFYLNQKIRKKINRLIKIILLFKLNF